MATVVTLRAPVATISSALEGVEVVAGCERIGAEAGGRFDANNGLAKTVSDCLANSLAGNSEKLDELPQEPHLRHLFSW